MAISPSPRLIILFLYLLSPQTALSLENQEGEDIHEILPKFNLPKGLFPGAPNTYTLSSDGSFTVRLQRPCYVHFDDQIVYYDTHIKGNLRSGSVSSVSGIQAKKFFLWVPVTGMDLDSDSNSIQFHVGALSQSLPADRFQEVPRCLSNIGHRLNFIPLSSD